MCTLPVEYFIFKNLLFCGLCGFFVFCLGFWGFLFFWGGGSVGVGGGWRALTFIHDSTYDDKQYSKR